MRLVLSAALQLADQPPPVLPTILALACPAAAATAPAGQQLQLQQGRQGRLQAPLAIECRDSPLTCVLMLPDGAGMLAAGGSHQTRFGGPPLLQLAVQCIRAAAAGSSFG